MASRRKTGAHGQLLPADPAARDGRIADLPARHPTTGIVVVVGAPVGGGHMEAARMIATQLRRASRGAFEVVVEDIGSSVRLGPWRLGPAIEKVYQWSVIALRGIPHRLLFSAANRWPGFLPATFRRVFGRQLNSRMVALKPDVVISTLHIASAALAALLCTRDVPVIAVVTDGGRVNRMWFEGPVKHFVFSSGHSARAALSRGLPTARVSTISDVLFPDRAAIPSRPRARRTLALPDRFTVLVTAGLVGYGPRLPELVGRLTSDAVPVQLLLAPGKNERLRRQFKARVATTSVFIDPASSLIPYLAAADIIVGKAGWLTLMESFAVGRPTLIVDHINGQEDENMRVACAGGFARRVDPFEAVRLIAAYTADEAQMARDFPGLRGARREPGCGEELTALVVDAMNAKRGRNQPTSCSSSLRQV